MKCRICGVGFVPNPPGFDYDQTYFKKDGDRCDRRYGYADYVGDADNIRRTFRRRLDMLARLFPDAFAPGCAVLDVGCAAGFFLEVAEERGLRATGVDVSGWAVERAREKGLDACPGSLEECAFPPGSFDAVAAWDVLEHLRDPAAFAAEAFRVLRPGGVLALTTPDASSLPARLLGRRWPNWRKVPEHVFFFTRRSLRVLLERNGFEPAVFRLEGKYVTLGHVMANLREYPAVSRLVPPAGTRLRGSLYVNPLDIVLVVARKRERADAA